VNREGNQLRLSPLLPVAWNSFKIHYRHHQAVYHITITRLPADSIEEISLTIDGRSEIGNILPLLDDGLEHEVEMKIR
jgi:cellobiose phosphorylase